MKKDKRVDAYIAKSQPFAQPILIHFRKVVHTACPEGEETIKWGFPHFDYKGIMCAIAAFKKHCAIGFWKGSRLVDTGDHLQQLNRDAMGHLGRITSLADLPPDKVLSGFIKQAMKLNDDGVKVHVRPKNKVKEPLVVPAFLKAALKKNKKASATFENFAYSHKKEYIEWLNEAKTDETRDKRLATALEWMAEGKSRNWKYMKK